MGCDMSYSVNFLEETITAVEQNGYLIQDIIFIGSVESGHECTWDEFCKLADFEYDDGYGMQFVPIDLTIAMVDGGRFYRYEFDGDEGWQFLQPILPNRYRKPKKIQTLRTDKELHNRFTIQQINGD